MLYITKVNTVNTASLSDAIKVNIILINLDLSRNNIGNSGAGSYSDTI